MLPPGAWNSEVTMLEGFSRSEIKTSGARIVTTLVHELNRRDAKRGLAAMCIGVGQGIAIAVQR